MKILQYVLLGAVLIQFIPFGRTHTNPLEFATDQGTDAQSLL